MGVNALYNNTTGDAILLLVYPLAPTSPQVVTTSILATLVLPLSPTPFASVDERTIATFIAGIRGGCAPGIVLLCGSGKLGSCFFVTTLQGGDQTNGQSERMIHALDPVTFRYKNELDPRASRNSV